MKNVFLIFFLFFSGAAAAKNYYVSASGNNSNTGLTSSAPWQTIAKVNSSFSSIAAGDSILFRRGDVFYGALVVGKSGSSGKPIVISAYGTGERPVFSGYTTLTGWTSAGGGIYQVSVPKAKSNLNLVTLNNKPQAMGRYPNADTDNGGYLSYETFSGTSSITDNQLPSTPNWTGAKVVIRKAMWITDRCKITSHSGNTINFTDISGYNGNVGYGYFIQDDPRTLDKLGEWYLNKSTKVFQMYFGTASPASYSIKVATIDTLIRLTSRNYININNIDFEGANGDAICGINSSYINIQNCELVNVGEDGIYTTGSSNLLIENINTNNVLSNGISVNGSTSSNITIRGCKIKNTGTLTGMGQDNSGSYKGIMAIIGSNLLIEYNRLDTTGYCGIEFRGNNVTVKNNRVDYFCFIKDNGGGIYTWAGGTAADPGPTYTNRVIQGNIISHSIGARDGRTGANTYDDGIFLDGTSMNVNITGNTTFNNARGGINANNPTNVSITDNTSFNNALYQISSVRWYWGSIKNLVIKRNILYSTNQTQRNYSYTNTGLNEPVVTTVQNAVKSMAGSIDSNYYSPLNPIGFTFTITPYHGQKQIPQSPLSLEGWQPFSEFDLKGKKPAKLPASYKLNKLTSSTKVTNGTFTSNISGVTVFGNNVTGSWDNTGKISGGAFKFAFSAPVANSYGQVRFPVGAISSAKNYILRFTTVGSNQQGIARAFLRKNGSPFTTLAPIQVSSFGTSKKTHEILFAAPITDALVDLVLEVEQFSGTTYIDNVEFYEADATLFKLEDHLRLEYNDTKAAKTISLGANYTDVSGTAYTGSITLQPFTSKILVKDTGTITTPTPTTMKASGTSAAINCFGSTANTTISASGGTSPYTGTGTFSVSAGKGALLVATKTATAATYTSLYYTIGAVSSTKNYVLKFSTLRSAGTANLRASIRQTGTPYTVITAKQTATISTSRIDHSFLFTAPTTQAAASFYIEIEQTAGNTYVDNIGFFEATSAGELIGNNLYAYGQFETDVKQITTYSGNANHTATWDGTSKISSTYYYKVTDAKSNTAVAEVKTTQPAAALKATATASAKITKTGGTTTIVVAASGGTAPYTGTGSFVKGVGTYSYTVTDAKGCTSVATITLSITAARTLSTSTTTTAVSDATVAVVSKSLQLTAYPNPTTTSFSLMVQGGTTEKVSVQVYSAEGKILYQTTGNTNTKYTFGNSFMTGVYIVKVVQGNSIQTLKLLKSN